MLAYAANSPVVVDRKPHPNAMLAIIAVHVALLAVVMSAKMDLPRHIFDQPTKVFWVPKPRTPLPPPPISAHQTVQNQNNWIDRPDTHVKTTTDFPPIDTGGKTVDLAPLGGAGATVIREIPNRIVTLPISSGPQLLTQSSELKPPYPPSKLLNEEEAVLRLRLTIDASGRVIAVDPVGRTDAAFLEAARRHLIAHWRSKPAMDDGHPVASSEVITLRFELNG
jgi:periplasmic protein TonB